MADAKEKAAEIAALRELASRSKNKKKWLTSLALLAAGNASDMASSWGHREANPLLAGKDGRFGAKGMAIKGGAAGGLALAQYLLGRKRPDLYKPFSYMNYGAAAVPAAVSVRNWRMPDD